jgi:Fe-S-cluster containining protein
MNDAFPCTGCGACCRSVRLSELTAALDRGDGVCRYLNDAQNTCTIYDTRPDICNIRRLYEQHFKSNISWSKFVDLNLIACEELLKQQQIKFKDGLV